MGRRQFTALVRVDEGVWNYEKLSSSAPNPDTFTYNGKGKLISLNLTVTNSVAVTLVIDGVNIMTAETWNFSSTLYSLSKFDSSISLTILGSGAQAEKAVLSYTKE